MANLLQQLSSGIDGASFDGSLNGEIAKLVEIADLAIALKDNPSGTAGFAAALANLMIPNLPDGTEVGQGLAQARAAIGRVTTGAAPDVLTDLSGFATLVAEDLVPLLARTIDAARAIEGIAKAEFVCPPQPDPTSPEPPPVPPSGATRAAVAQERATDISTRIDQLPSPLTPAALLDFLVGLAGDPEQSALLPIPLPLLDDIVLPVQTLGRWSLSTPTDIGVELASTLAVLRDRLTAGTAIIDTSAATAAALETPLRVAELQSFVNDYEATATAVAVALEANDPATAASEAAALDTHIATFETLRATQAVDFTARVPATAIELNDLALSVHDRLLHLASQLEPLDPGVFIAAVTQPVPADAAAQQALRDQLAPIVNFMEDLGEKLDLSAIQGGVGTVATDAQAIADQISGALATVAQETRATFAEVETAIQTLPLDDLATEIRAVFGDAATTLRREIEDAFAPLRDALAAAIQTVIDAVATLDPQAISDAVTQAISEVTAILQDPAIVDATNEIRNALEQVADATGNLSFAPVTDEIVGLIGQMESGLRTLDSTDLNDALVGLLNAALSVLPPDLRPVTQPLIDDLGVRINQGPVELLEKM